MQKQMVIWVAILACCANFAAAQIVARGKVLNQTAQIPQKTIFTPSASGLFRLSIYGEISVADSTSTSSWFFSLNWTDDSGVASAGGPIYGPGNTAGSFYNFISRGGVALPIEAKAGTPITFAVTQNGATDKSEYSLYWTLEKLE